jgi:signal transduction histidine kinase
MLESAAMSAHPASAPPAAPRGRRRRIVVDPPYQLRRGLLMGAVALVLLALLNVVLVSHGRGTAPAGTMVSAAAAVADGGVSFVLVLFSSALFLAGVVFVAILDSHRTAGASYAIRRTVEAVREGRAGERVRLRKNDHLKALADSVNRLAEAIDAERARREG